MLRTSNQLSLDLDSILADYAVKNATGKPRLKPEEADKFRSRFQLDRDRILHSKPFRRLKNKTQVFTPSTGDHFRDRLTHTLEVSQVARGLARMLRLNEDLAEVIALAHDLGHTPFGHCGEDALRDCLIPHGLNFEHNEQSLYLVTPFNLSQEVLEGLQKHQTPYDQSSNEFIGATLEAQIVNFADEIAYHHHDLDDGLRSNLLKPEDFTTLQLFELAAKDLPADLDPLEHRLKFISQMMKLMIEDLAQETSSRIEKNKIQTLEDVYNFETKLVSFSSSMQPMVLEIRAYLFKNFYLNPMVTAQTDKGKLIIQALFKHYLADPALDVMMIKDYISGMTDSYALTKFEEYALS